MSNEQAGVAVSANKKQNTGLVPNLRFPEFRDAGEWGEKKLGEVATFFKGRGLPKSVITPTGKNPCIHYGELFTEHQEVIQTVKNRTDLNENIFLSVENDVLMPTSDVTPNGLAKACCIKLNDVILGGDILIIRTDQQEIDGEFLARYIRHLEQKVLQLVSGSTVFHLYATSIDKLSLSFPLKQEQQKIADCLTSLDDLIRLEAGKLDALKAHKKGLMQQLFPAEGETLPKLRFPEFREAGEWEVKKFGELCVFVRGPFGGALKKDIFVSNGFAVYEQSHAISGDFSAFRYFLTEKKYQELKRFSVQPGDIIMSCSGTMGKFSIIPKNYKAGIINQALLKLSVNKDYYLDFVKLALELPNNQEKLLSQSAGGAIKNVVGVKEIKEIELCLPSEKEQQKIADCLSALDTQITTQAEKIDALKAHKKGLMQQLFPQIGEVGA